MKKVSQFAAVIALGAACAMPVMAQDAGTSSSTSPSVSTSPSTQGMGATPDTSSSTQAMGAGPDMDSNGMATREDDGPDMGWIGLLGLAGLLGLRRRRHHDDMDHRRTSTVR